VRTFVRFVAGALLAVTLLAMGALAWMVRPGAEAIRLTSTEMAEQHWTPDRPLWVLLLGDDQRGQTGCGCSDAIHLVGVPAGGGSAVMLNIPRDTRVTIPGKGQRRVNEAYARGGPALAAEVVGQLVGVPISYVLVTTFGGLRSMVDELGGVDINLPSRLRDRNVGFDAGPGVVHLDGAQALAYARSRKTYPDGDIHRTQNQAQLLLAVLAKLRSEGDSPTDTLRYLTTLIRHTRVQGGGTADLYRLARLALTIDPSHVSTVVPPVRGITVSGASMLELLPASRTLFADLADDAVLQSH
jgi:polyisoprenyl-teichoic acid--peptidoglycan teichoic acid transferase